MRPILDMDVVQIEVTNFCYQSCSNCTRLCGHYKKPYFMGLKEFKQAVDSMVGYPKQVGCMGGEPLAHPEFAQLCEYLRSKIPKEQCGLWTCLPRGKEYYREIIVETFGNIYINDHTREDILHCPVLVASEEVDLPPWKKDYLVSKCWVQESWSACVNPKGAWFCEVAGALAMALDIKDLGWPVEHGWWGRSPQHFISQMKMCHYCGCAMPLKKRRSVEEVDDISPKMLERLKKVSPKIKKGKYQVSDCKPSEATDGPMATYKDQYYRDMIAKRYGMFLLQNEKGFLTPYLMRNYKQEN
jgi:hypothetical protein